MCSPCRLVRGPQWYLIHDLLCQICMDVCMLCQNVCQNVLMYVYIYIHTYIHRCTLLLYIHMYIMSMRMYVCIYVYIHTYRSTRDWHTHMCPPPTPLPPHTQPDSNLSWRVPCGVSVWAPSETRGSVNKGGWGGARRVSGCPWWRSGSAFVEGFRV